MNEPAARVVLLPRVVRLADAPAYLGMSAERFEFEVRPGLREVPLGGRVIAFDREELDRWWDLYSLSHGRPGRQPTREKDRWKKIDEAKRQDSCGDTGSGTSTSASGDTDAFARAAERAISRKRKNT